MNRYEAMSAITGRMKRITEAASGTFTGRLNHRISRLEADTFRQRVIQRTGKRTVDRSLKKHIKAVCRQRFGSSGYWHWLALYTEMRGEFHENWLPVDFYRFTLLPKWNSFSEASLYKTFDYQLFGDFAIRPVLRIVDGSAFGYDGAFIKSDILKEYLRERFAEVVVKIDSGRSGSGTFFLDTGNIRIEELLKHRSCIIQPVLKQHKFHQSLSGSSVNTMRITTFLDENGIVNILFVKQKFGMEGSRIDHLGSGGMFIKLNDRGESVTNAIGAYGAGQLDVHPEHKFRFRGLRVPGYHSAVERCMEAHLKFPYTRIIGWDVAIDEAGEPKLVEWNARRPGIWLDEALFGPHWQGKGNSLRVRP